MKRLSVVFLKVATVLFAVVIAFGMIRFPQTEGRATNLDLISIYTDPLIIYSYIASIPFFFALYQAFKLLGYVENNKIFSQLGVKAVKKIKHCALMIPLFIIGAQVFIFVNVNGDDATGPIALGIYTTFASLIIASAAAVFQNILQNAIDFKLKK